MPLIPKYFNAKVSHCEWIKSAQSGIKMNPTESQKRKEILEEFLAFIIFDLLIPLLRVYPLDFIFYQFDSP